MGIQKHNTWEFRCDTDQVVCHEFRIYTVPERTTAIEMVRGIGWQWLSSGTYCYKHNLGTQEARSLFEMRVGA